MKKMMLRVAAGVVMLASVNAQTVKWTVDLPLPQGALGSSAQATELLAMAYVVNGCR